MIDNVQERINKIKKEEELSKKFEELVNGGNEYKDEYEKDNYAEFQLYSDSETDLEIKEQEKIGSNYIRNLIENFVDAYKEAASDCYVLLRSLERLYKVEAELSMNRTIHKKIAEGEITYEDIVNHGMDSVEKISKAIGVGSDGVDGSTNNGVSGNTNGNVSGDVNGNTNNYNEGDILATRLLRFKEIITGIQDGNGNDDHGNGDLGNDDMNSENDDNGNGHSDNDNDDSMSSLDEDIESALEKFNENKIKKDLMNLKLDRLLNIDSYLGEDSIDVDGRNNAKVLNFMNKFYDRLNKNAKIVRKKFGL